MVLPDGSVVVANANGTLVTSENGLSEWSPDTDLFWAVRGGGAGPWGVVTDITVKLHKPRFEYFWSLKNLIISQTEMDVKKTVIPNGPSSGAANLRRMMPRWLQM